MESGVGSRSSPNIPEVDPALTHYSGTLENCSGSVKVTANLVKDKDTLPAVRVPQTSPLPGL